MGDLESVRKYLRRLSREERGELVKQLLFDDVNPSELGKQMAHTPGGDADNFYHAVYDKTGVEPETVIQFDDPPRNPLEAKADRAEDAMGNENRASWYDYNGPLNEDFEMYLAHKRAGSKMPETLDEYAKERQEWDS